MICYHFFSLSLPVVLQLSSSQPVINTGKYLTASYQNWRSQCRLVGGRLHGSLSRIFPILSWAPAYRREWAYSDLIAGLTLVSLHIPQAIAYARLAGVPPIHGLYVSIIPAFIYALMGTSRQISIGTFAVASIACRDIVTKFDDTNNESPITPEKSIEILCTLAFLVGLIQLVVGMLKLGALKALLSDALISAFVGASTLHVLTSQIGTLAGLDESIKRRAGLCSLVRTWYSFMENILTANLFTAVLSVGTLTVLWTTKEYLESYVSRRFTLKNVIIPIDIICIVTLTIASNLFDFHGRFGVTLVSSISGPIDISGSGLSSIPKMINFEYIPHLLSSAVVLSIIIYVTSYSLANIFANRHQYKISANQELLALGVANLVSSFAQCYPCSGSLSRSLVQERVGGKTQASSLISVLFVTIFALKFTHLLALLPKCALAAIIVCALIPSLGKLNQLRHFWAISPLDGTVWAVTFGTVTFIGVETGLLIGLALSTFHFIVETFK